VILSIKINNPFLSLSKLFWYIFFQLNSKRKRIFFYALILLVNCQNLLSLKSHYFLCCCWVGFFFVSPFFSSFFPVLGIVIDKPFYLKPTTKMKKKIKKEKTMWKTSLFYIQKKVYFSIPYILSISYLYAEVVFRVQYIHLSSVSKN
jgi:hypothetical protein